MADEQDTGKPDIPEDARSPEPDDLADDKPATATAAPRKRPAPAKPRPRQLPPWKVLLHNDDVNEMLFVVRTIIELTPLTQIVAIKRMLEAHQRGLTLLLTTHQERAELYRDQFASKGLKVTIEPDEQ